MKYPRRFGKLIWGGFILLVSLTGLALGVSPLQRGLTARYYPNPERTDPPFYTTRDEAPTIQRMQKEFRTRPTRYSIRWTGTIFIPVSGTYGFATISDDGSELWLNHQLVVDNRGEHGIQERSATLVLQRGFYPIDIRYSQIQGGAHFKVLWTPPGKKPERLAHALLFSQDAVTWRAYCLYRTRIIGGMILAAIWCVLSLFTAFRYFPRLAQYLRASQFFHSVSFKLLLFWVLNSLILNILLSSLGERSTLKVSQFFLRSSTHTGFDSWKHMRTALDFVHANPAASLYQELFFTQSLKFQYPPTSLLLIEPFSRLSLEEFEYAANFISWLLVLMTCPFLTQILILGLERYTGKKEVHWTERGFWLFLVCGFTLTFYPLLKSYELGQIQTWLYGCCVFALWFWLTDRPGLAGACIGLITIVKPQLGLLVIWGGLRKYWRFTLGFLMIVIVFGLMSVAVYGYANHLDYLQVLSFIAKHGESYHPNQSVNGLLHRLFQNGPNVQADVRRFAPYNFWVYAGTMVSSFLLLGTALFWKTGPSRQTAPLDFVIAILTCTLASPVAWEHHYSVLLPAFAVAFPAALGSLPKRSGLALLALAYMLSSNLYAFTLSLAPTHWNFLQSYLFFGAVITLLQLYRLRALKT